MMGEQLDKQNVWVPSMGRTPAEYGSESMLSLLSRTLDRSIIMLHGPSMSMLRSRPGEAGLRSEEKKHQLHNPLSKRLFRRELNMIGVLIHVETHPDTLVLEHVNGNHFHGYAHKGVAPDQLPACLSWLAKAKEALASRHVSHAGSR